MAAPKASQGGREDDKRIARGDLTRSQIVTAALDVLGSLGFSETTVRSVAEQAGVQPSLIHYHFGTMEALFVAVLEQENERLSRGWEEIANSDLALSEKLLATTAYLRQAATMRHSRQLWELWAAGLANEELATHWRAAILKHRETVRQALEQWTTELDVALPMDVDVLAGAYADFLLGVEVSLLGGISDHTATRLDAIEALATFIAQAEEQARARGLNSSLTRAD